jgi:hypothetical protein
MLGTITIKACRTASCLSTQMTLAFAPYWQTATLPKKAGTHGPRSQEVTFHDSVTPGLYQRKNYESHIAFFEAERRCKNPEYRVDCIEFIKDWIPKQQEIIGCQMNLWEVEVLQLLTHTMELAIVVNYHPWMDKTNKGHYEKAFKSMNEFYPRMKKTMSSGAEDKCGVKVYKNFTSNAGWEQQHIMHEKFLLGRTTSPGENTIKTSVIYGSFNLSQTAAKGNWESILVFNKNDDLWVDLCKNFMIAWGDSRSIPWEDLCQGSDLRQSNTDAESCR